MTIALRRRRISRGASPPAPPEPDPITVVHAWVGAVSPNTAIIKARITDSAVADVVLAGGGPTVAGTEGANDIFTFTITGLSPDTVYPYSFPGSAVVGQIHTFPTEGSQASFTVAAGGDTGNLPEYPGPGGWTSNSPAFDRILDRDPALFIHLGDMHYANVTTNSVSLFRTAWQNVLANARFSGLVAKVPTAYTPDNHDYGGDNSNKNFVGKAACHQVYREFVPHWELPADSRPAGNGEWYQTFVIGRVRFILLDVRSERSPNGQTDNASKTRIGVDQKAWFKAVLLAATEPCIVVDVHSSWGFLTYTDAWQKYSTERRELAEFFEDNDLTSRIIMLGADMHELQADDGTNMQFDPDSVNPGPAYFDFSPLDSAWNHFGGTFSDGVYQVRHQQYGTLDFDDQGTQIVVTAKGWAVTDGSEAEVFSLDLTFPAEFSGPVDNAVYGSVAADTKANLRIGPDGKISHRFRATQSSALNSVRWSQRWGAVYSGGTGGAILVTVQADSAGNPSGTPLASCPSYVPGNPGDQTKFLNHSFSSPATLTAGTLYHIVFENTDGAPSTNYISVNEVAVLVPTTPRCPYYPDADYLTMQKIGAGAWASTSSGGGDYIAVMDLTYANGQHDGQQYIEAMIAQVGTINGSSSMVRERFTVSGGNKITTGAAVRVKRTSGSDVLTVRLEDTGGTLIDSFTVAAAGISTSDHTWASGSWGMNRTLVSGTTYNLRVSTASGSTYTANPVRQGYDSGDNGGTGNPTGFRSDRFKDGISAAAGGGQKTTDGSTWSAMYSFSPVDLQFYFVLA